jgi:hypothetical protein
MTGLYLHPLRLAALSEGRLSVLRVPVTKQTSRVTSCPWEYLGWKMVWIDPGLGDGPYLKVSAKDGETVHRVYPRMGDGDYFVKEAWCCEVDPLTSKPTGKILYKADGQEVMLDDGDGSWAENKDGTFASPWSSPMHMKEEDSRYILTLGPPVPGKLGEVKVFEVAMEGALKAGPINGDEYQTFWNTIYPPPPLVAGPLDVGIPGELEEAMSNPARFIGLADEWCREHPEKGGRR